MREFSDEYKDMDWNVKYPLTEQQIKDLFNALKNAEINKEKIPEHIRNKFGVTDLIYVPWRPYYKIADWEKEEGF
jgi:hypothetical protein